MYFMNVWVLVLLLPLYLFYKQQIQRFTHHVLFDDRTLGIRQVQLLFIALSLILVALSRPVITTVKVDEKFDSQEFIIAIDASFSMQADDLNPTRYAVSKAGIKKLLLSHPTDRFSIFAFTSNALLISPPTTDSTISFMALDALKPQYILTKSTDLNALLKTIAKSTFQEKKLIIFTDGGDEKNLNKLLTICKTNAITLYIVATGSKRGASLRKDGKLIKDQYSSLVISRINPILKELAQESGGKYYELDSSDLSIINQLSDDLSTKIKEEATVSVASYRDLYYLPLGIAIILFVFSVTNLHQRTLLLLVALIFVPQSVRASMFDFYYIDNANQQFEAKAYNSAAKNFSRVRPSPKSYYNIGVANYKAHKYKDAMHYFGMIQTKNSVLKQKLFYNMGNCAVRLERYDRAMLYYRQALTLGEDEDARYNLQLMQKLHIRNKVNVTDMLPQKDPQTKKNSSKKLDNTNDTKKEGSSNSKNKQNSNESSAGSGSSKKGNTQKAKNMSQNEKSKAKYKVGYKLYELINKGYTDEKEPW